MIITYYYEYRLLYKNLKFAINYIKNLKSSEFNNTNLVQVLTTLSEDYTDTTKKIGNDLKSGKKELPDFKKLAAKLLKEVRKLFKNYKIDMKNLPPDMLFKRSLLTYFGGKLPVNIRKNCNESQFDSSGNRIADDDKLDSDSKKLRTWMSRLKSETMLHEINIPGSYDSATSRLGPTSVKDLFGKMAQTQTASLTGQLNAGIRYFDLRIRKIKKVYKSC